MWNGKLARSSRYTAEGLAGLGLGRRVGGDQRTWVPSQVGLEEGLLPPSGVSLQRGGQRGACS